MTDHNLDTPITLFYSYSHKDSRPRERMDTALNPLREHGLRTWSDQRIPAGEQISTEIKQKMEETDIFVFLMSPDFMASSACREEWRYANVIAQKKASVKLIPVILRSCPWKDFGQMSRLMALPRDGKPVKKFRNVDDGWKQVYDGIKLVVDKLKATFIPKPNFVKQMQDTEFISQNNVPLQDIFVFPKLTTYSTKINAREAEIEIQNDKDLLEPNYTLLHGDKLAGKTALCRHLFLERTHRKRPVLYIDLEDIARKHPTVHILKTAYSEQFSGDFAVWNGQEDKLVILDNLTNDQKILAHVLRISDQFDRVIVTVSTDTFHAYFRDNPDISKFRQVRICPLTHAMQESLIRKRLASINSLRSDSYKSGRTMTDGSVDIIENQVNSIIINNRILPRYPFYVLSIIQTYEGYMPSDLSITSYGHCYHVLIVSHLQKAGVSHSDDQLDSCFNFGAHLAFEIFSCNSAQFSLGRLRFDEFVERYGAKFVITESTLQKICDVSYGIVKKDNGQFRYSYMYYYFLGKYLANNLKEHADVLNTIISRSHIERNCLALIFTIHHTNNICLIDDILLQTMCSLDSLHPSRLDANESKIFDETISEIPPQILSSEPVTVQRKRERDARDLSETRSEESIDSEHDDHEEVNQVYKILKNNEILGQILRNKYGSLQRDKIVEIIETIADGGLRLVSLVIGDKEQIQDLAVFLHRQLPEINLNELKQLVHRFLFLWTIINVERIVSALNKPELCESVDEALGSKDAPAYELIRYFLRLDTTSKFSKADRDSLKRLWGRHRFSFFQRVVSLRTQHYFNTHRVDRAIEQSACSVLGIRYRPKVKQLESIDSSADSNAKHSKSSRRSSGRSR